MLFEILQEINNYFDVDRRFGGFEVVGGQLTGAEGFLREGQWYRIVGSVFNDGVHRYGDCDLSDERFDGSVWALAVPPAVVALADEIRLWKQRNDGANTAFVSESFGGYSYERAKDTTGAPMGWQGVYRQSLNKWRRMP